MLVIVKEILYCGKGRQIPIWKQWYNSDPPVNILINDFNDLPVISTAVE